MKTRRFTRCLPLLAALMAGSAWAVDNLGLFELDHNGPFKADAADNGLGGGGDDWQNIADGTHSAIAVTMGTTGGIINDVKGNNDDVFTGGGTKDDNDLNLWKHKTAKATPDKDNITNAYAAAYQNGGDTIIYFGADRFANNGDAQIGFWFFQNEITELANGTFSAGHMNGDILVLANFLNGGVNVSIEVWKWVAGGGDNGNNNLMFLASGGECDGLGQVACALTNNPVTSTDTPSFWGYRPKFGSAEFFPKNSLFEGGINISELLGDQTVCFASFMAETRTSQSTDAVLKDFALGGFNLCGIDVTKDCRDLNGDDPGQAIISADGSTITVGYEGTVENTGVVGYTVDLTDSANPNGGTLGGAGITQVCIDASGNGLCEADEEIGVINGDGTATFPLGGGETALYIGEFTVTGEVTSLSFVDVISANATIDGEDVFDDPTTATATCVAFGDADIEVLKMCSNPTIVGGDTFEADITGVATNTGNVKLNLVSLSDVTDFGAPAGAYTFVRDENFNGQVDVGEPAFSSGVDSLAPGEAVAFAAKVSSTSFTSHGNTITASGTNAFDGDDKPSDSASVDETDACSVSPDPVIDIEKVCDDTFGSNGSGVELTHEGGLVAVQVHNKLTVTNNGNEDLKDVEVSDDEGGLAFVSATDGASFDCSAGTSCTGTLQVGESAEFSMSYLPDAASSIIGALTNPGGILFENTASAIGVGVLSKSDTPLVQDDAECALCN
jgi:hypothetical protein